MERKKHRLKEFTSVVDENQNQFVNVDLSGERKMMPPGEINHIVDVGERFNKERQESSLYRFIFTISPLFSNPLFNITNHPQSHTWGTIGASTSYNDYNSWSTFKEDIFKKEPLDGDLQQIDYNYEESINKHLKEVDGWFGFTDPDVTKTEACRFYDMEPSRKRFDLNSNVAKNWDILITYPASADTEHHIVKGGLLIVNGEEVEVGGRAMVALGTASYHGLVSGDKVTLSGMSNSNLDGTFRVERVGLDNGDYKDNFFVIDRNPTDPLIAGTLGPSFGEGRMRKNFFGELSTYYVRQFKNLMVDKNNYEIYPLGFSKNIFNDQNHQLVITEDIDVGGLTDNLGRPLSELYLTFIKTDSNGVFNGVKSGFDLEFLEGNLSDEQLCNIRRIHDGSTDPFQTHDPLEFGVNFNWDLFQGDIVEYNRFTLRETILSDVLHRFNTVNRETRGSSTSQPGGQRREGYIYKPHHPIKIREFSLYIEQGDDFTAGIPEYAEDLGDGRYLWRDFLDIGLYDGEGGFLDYPFTNGHHYIHSNICLKTMRQDPWGAYGLYYAGTPGNPDDETVFDPADPRGDAITDRFRVRSSGDAC
jgi:hypothetical protein